MTMEDMKLEVVSYVSAQEALSLNLQEKWTEAKTLDGNTGDKSNVEYNYHIIMVLYKQSERTKCHEI
jgi:hypothetical protein